MLTHTANGQEAYDYIMAGVAAGNLDQRVKCLITDIEMPQMDGHRLVKLLKEDDTYLPHGATQINGDG